MPYQMMMILLYVGAADSWSGVKGDNGRGATMSI